MKIGESEIREKREILIMVIVGIISAVTNLAVGFFVGLLLFFVLKRIHGKNFL